MKNLFVLAGLVIFAASFGVEAAPPDFSLCDDVPVKRGLRGMCYGYQASGCSYESEEQNCIQLELVFNEKADSLALFNLIMPGSQPAEGDCILTPTCQISSIKYSVSLPSSVAIKKFTCDFSIGSAADICAEDIHDFCRKRGSNDSLSLIRSQVVIDQRDCGL